MKAHDDESRHDMVLRLDKGAHFYRCDFQVHSPRDRAWKGQDCVTDEERMKYARTLVGACRDKELHAIAITDHHDLCFFPYVQKAAAEELCQNGEPIPDADRLVVFPGIELTLPVPCQAIVILDSDFENSRLTSVLQVLTVDPSLPREAKTIETERLKSFDTIEKLAHSLDSHKWLRGRYIILPNISQGGKMTLMRDGMNVIYSTMPCVGGYVDGSVEIFKDGHWNKLNGREREWGFKKVAALQTSDNRSASHELLGMHSTWVKWAKPTAEAIRQACLADKSRLSHSSPRYPSMRIERVSVSNSKFLGRIDLLINPQYTALIGGRGTGKSTVLEYIRWALCDQPPNIADEDTPDYERRRKRLIENTLKSHDASVDLHFNLNGVPHTVRRSSADGSVRIKVGDGALEETSPEQVRSLLPIQAYSQKQLSGVSVRIDELIRFLELPIKQKLDNCLSRAKSHSSRIDEIYARVQQREYLAQQLKRRSVDQKSLSDQVESIKKGLRSISDDDRRLISKAQFFEDANQLVDSFRVELESYADALRTTQAEMFVSIRNVSNGPTDLGEEENKLFDKIARNYKQRLESAEKSIAAALSSLRFEADGQQESPSSAWTEWSTTYATHKHKLEEALSRSSSEKEQLELLRLKSDELAVHRKETARLEANLSALSSAPEIYRAEREAWRRAYHDFDDLLSGQCELLSKQSNGLIRAEFVRYANAHQFCERLQEQLAGSGMRATKIGELEEWIVSCDDPERVHELVLAELEALAYYSSSEGSLEPLPTSPNLKECGIRESDLTRIANKLTPEGWLLLSKVRISSEPRFYYKSRDDDYIPFSDASAGQQATALLKILLNQEGAPLIIDQPEEDLDNPVMEEIFNQLWDAKKKRQIIFASHNANLVVNGDAELVVWFDHINVGDQSGGKIAGEGAIDIKETREAIKRIMEGGEDAFKLRHQKYGF